MDEVQMPEFKGRVLIIDDSETNRFVFASVLKRAGFETSEASSGLEGLLKVHPHPDLILLDVNLPDINGFEVCSRFRSSELRFTPIIQTSATYVTQGDFLKGVDRGADMYLVSPIDPDLLVECVEALIGRRKSREVSPRA